jgi:hypothetical protein
MIQPTENQTQDPEDRLIRWILIGLATGAVLTFLLVATVITVMISYNWNFLNWME